MISSSSDQSSISFIEIFHPQQQFDHSSSDNYNTATTDVCVVTLTNPKECASFVKHLSSVLPLSTSLSHFKRVQRQQPIILRPPPQQPQQHAITKHTDRSNDNSIKNEECHAKSEELIESNNENSTSYKKSRKRLKVDRMQEEEEEQQQPDSEASNNDSKRTHPSIILKVLLARKDEMEERFGPFRSWKYNDNSKSSIDDTVLLTNANTTRDDIFTLFTVLKDPQTVMTTMDIVAVPKSQPKSEKEWKYMNEMIWPTSFLPNQWIENRITEQRIQNQLNESEVVQMTDSVNEAIKDALHFQHDDDYHCHFSGGVVIVNPENGQIVATAYDEYKVQQEQQNSVSNMSINNSITTVIVPNPLSASPYLHAIQGISRIERRNMKGVNFSEIDDTDKNEDDDISQQQQQQQQQQYLCTGYDVYATIEPSIYEAMALVHSRIRRLIFGCTMEVVLDVQCSDDTPSIRTAGTTTMNKNRIAPGMDSGIIDSHVHALPSTNHHYRAFMCQPQCDLWNRCFSLLRSSSHGGNHRDNANQTKEEESEYTRQKN